MIGEISTSMEEEMLVLILTKRIKTLMTLVKYGFFDMKGGSMTLHFKENGEIAKIERRDFFTVT